jgi:single-strand selective monofunctional uracil DNA glycosylase
VTLEASALRLRNSLAELTFGEHVYNPLDYAWPAHEEYLRRYASGRKRVVFLGMNPGPFGMVQTGVPFGEIEAVRDWMGIGVSFEPPAAQHPMRPVTGFACTRSEISGRRLWGFFRERYGTAASFFEEHTVLNYCPLAFMDESGRNRTPDRLPAGEREPLFRECDRHLRDVVRILDPVWLIGIGGFAARRAELALDRETVRVGRLEHPSPANPRANQGWPALATAQLVEQGVWV